MSTSMLVRVALAAVAGVAFAGGPSPAPVAQSVPDATPDTAATAVAEHAPGTVR